jgi:hypothetical protein
MEPRQLVSSLLTNSGYLFDCIEDAISRDLKTELDFLTSYAVAMKAIQNVVDMPNQRAALQEIRGRKQAPFGDDSPIRQLGAVPK